MRTINWIGYDEQTGYGNASAGLIKALQEEGVSVEQTLIKRGNPGNGGKLVSDESSGAHSKAEAVVIHTVPEYYPYWVKRRRAALPHAPIWGYTAWETDRIPSHWTGLLNSMDGIFVPSRWNREVLLACGVQVPVAVLPHVSEFQGQKPEVAPSRPLAAALEQAEGDFLFYCINMWNERKNIPLLIQAFLEEFGQEEKVSLLLKTDRSDWSVYRRNWRRLYLKPSFGSSRKSFKELTQHHPNRSRVIHLTSPLPAADLAWIHQKGDCFISCTRGEGWGMGAYEAAWYGNAVAMTSYGGQLDYLSPDDAYLMPYTLKAVETAYGGASYAREQRWADVDIREVRAVLRAVFSNQTKARERGALLRQRVSGTFTNTRIANTCTEVLFHD
ncbi:glycosyltransferase family 4 protein [Paenibacillus pinistramenti]|uniref:glycosyltransferase family 4 protein n=1 Tax=Paenibacillus pinistramenti TaxID=1768003 RepID=UPI00110976ED|nr:glycosyltransferase family 4 protein [Paenibacillus pinistramenti]